MVAMQWYCVKLLRQLLIMALNVASNIRLALRDASMLDGPAERYVEYVAGLLQRASDSSVHACATSLPPVRM